MARRFQVDVTLYLGLALALLMLPFSWLVAAVLAAMFHELCHIAAARSLKLSWSGFAADTGGMVIYMGAMLPKETILVTAAGPLGSLLLIILVRIWPQIAVCGLAQGLFNLLPVYPLDGGRILYCLMGSKGRWIEGSAIFCVLLAGLFLSFYSELGISTLLLSVLVTVRAIQRKFPCKGANLGVQ